MPATVVVARVAGVVVVAVVEVLVARAGPALVVVVEACLQQR